VVLLALIVLNLPRPTADRLKLAISGLFVPLFGLGRSFQQLSGRVGDAVVPRGVLINDLERLRRENEELRVRAQRAEQTDRENAILRQLVGLQKQIPLKLKAGHIIGRDPANWWRTVQIDLGRRDGLREDLPVVTSEGLVGRVSAVGIASSQVALVGDANCRVSVLVQETRDNGIVTPASASILDQTVVDLTYLPRNSAIKPGHTIVTSGLGGVFPKGLNVGMVLDCRNSPVALYSEARVKLTVNSSKLEEVWVVVQ